MDFTLDTYRLLLETLLKKGYSFQPFVDYLENPQEKVIIMRHDVDKLPENAFLLAQIEKEFSISSSYYFRIIPEVLHEEIIKNIAGLGHEIGYHYEDIDLSSKKIRKNAGIQKNPSELETYLYKNGLESFIKNLESLRDIAPIRTICMHGSPLSKYDNRLLWKDHDYKQYGISGEPYFDLDYSKVLYLTDTGRRWDGAKVSIRDKIDSNVNNSGKNSHGPALSVYRFHSTFDIIEAANRNKLPDQIMINIHPQRWFNFGPWWIKELIFQNTKNLIKYTFLKHRQNKLSRKK